MEQGILHFIWDSVNCVGIFLLEIDFYGIIIFLFGLYAELNCVHFIISCIFMAESISNISSELTGSTRLDYCIDKNEIR